MENRLCRSGSARSRVFRLGGKLWLLIESELCTRDVWRNSEWAACDSCSYPPSYSEMEGLKQSINNAAWGGLEFVNVTAKVRTKNPFLSSFLLPLCHPHPQRRRQRRGVREIGKKLGLVTSSQPLYNVLPDQNSCIHPAFHSHGSLRKEATCWFIRDHPSDWAGMDAGWEPAPGMRAWMERLIGEGEEGTLGNGGPACLVMVLVICGDLGSWLAGWISAVLH